MWGGLSGGRGSESRRARFRGGNGETVLAQGPLQGRRGRPGAGEDGERKGAGIAWAASRTEQRIDPARDRRRGIDKTPRPRRDFAQPVADKREVGAGENPLIGPPPATLDEAR